VDSSNTINGKPIYYWTNKQDLTVPTDAGYVVLVNCKNIKVQNLNLSNGQGILLIWTTNSIITQNNLTNGHGIHLVYSSNNIVSENSITNNNYGIMISESSVNNIVNNNVTNNMVGGIHLRECKSIKIIGNKITHNNPNGIWLIDNSYNNTVLENHIEYNSIGILVEDSSENLIVGNTIQRNREWGIQLIAGQRNNSIYHNLFIDNRMWNDGIQVSIPGIDESGEWRPGHANLWDNGEYGNYWSDYLSRYPDAMEIDNLGVGNIPYHINPNNIDNHPLMEPIIIPEFSLLPILPIFIVLTIIGVIFRNKIRKK
jgi:parallel beta-helix repeat protein